MGKDESGSLLPWRQERFRLFCYWIDPGRLDLGLVLGSSLLVFLKVAQVPFPGNDSLLPFPQLQEGSGYKVEAKK